MMIYLNKAINVVINVKIRIIAIENRCVYPYMENIKTAVSIISIDTTKHNPVLVSPIIPKL